MRRILDKMFASKKLSMLIPILSSAILYVLFIIFGETGNKTDIIIATPIASVFWFFGVFLVFYIQVKNKSCPEGFLNWVEFIATLFFGIGWIANVIFIAISGLKGFTPMTSAGILTYAAIAWAHSKRSQ